MANVKVFGEMCPDVVIQQDPQACFPASLVPQADPRLEATEELIADHLATERIYTPNRGVTSLETAHTLDYSLGKIGVRACEGYDARIATPDEDEEPRIIERIQRIEDLLRSGIQVKVAFPKIREGENEFLHFVDITGYEEYPDGKYYAVADTSDVDGGIHYPTSLREYVTPTQHTPVMAWGIGNADTLIPNFGEETAEKSLPGISLLSNPLHKAEDTGIAIPPDTHHPSSVTMPNTYISRQFNELGGVVLSRKGEDPIGYPRFVVPRQVRELSREATGQSFNLPFPTRKSAEAAAYLTNTYGIEAEIIERNGLYWLPEGTDNLNAWQHTGLGISSRQAAANLEARPVNDIEKRERAEQKIKNVIEAHTDAKSDDIYLFPTGMAAIYWLNQTLINISEGVPGVQFGFPYTDTFEQRKYGPNRSVVKNIIDLRKGDYSELQKLVDSGQALRALITEYPSNPLLWTADFEQLDSILNGNTPLILDDTIGTMYNLDDGRLPNSVAARVTSLTKFFSCAGDVMGGAVILRPESPHYERLKEELEELYEDTLWYEDAEVLAMNSDHFPGVMSFINSNGDGLARWMEEEWTGEGKVLQKIYYPSLTSKESYDAVKKARGGYSGLMSMRFNDPSQAYRFFDALKVTKGPSLGTYYTLGCLYTLLAHKPVDSVKRFGVTPDLVRLSIGIEEIDKLKDRFAKALEA